MAVESRKVTHDLGKQKAGLIYDAETVTLLGKYNDELSAYRARKKWVEVLNSYFLLERDRDYEMFVESDLSESYFVVNCCFSSACGRYAFWRLINHQAPEAEHRLGCASLPSFSKAPAMANSAGSRDGLRPDAQRNAWVFTAVEEQTQLNGENTGLINRIIKLFQ